MKTVLNTGKTKIKSNFNMVFKNHIFHCIAETLKTESQEHELFFQQRLSIKFNETPTFHRSPLILIIFLSGCENESQISSVTNLRAKPTN